MKDMMAVLLQCAVYSFFPAYLPDQLIFRLKHISDPNQVAPDGQTIEGRMRTICAAAAADIREFSNACDTYAK
jgi:hypothetical protein